MPLVHWIFCSIAGLCNPKVIRTSRDWLTNNQLMVAPAYMYLNCGDALFNTEMRDPAEDDIFQNVEQLRDRHGKGYSRLVGFAHVVQRRALEDLARENPKALTKFWQCTDASSYYLFTELESRYRVREDVDMEFIGAHQCKRLASFLVL